ncbi:MAG: 3-hydroxyacyl-CoA dehydrogenase family protein, partial [Calditrichia bacterium]|nr:3-hydroxyacyl-CoA dehydrogenase family protein [Calditrichia bacterium]
QERTDLIENGDFITQFVDDLFINLRTGTDLELAQDAHMIFEAIVENVDIKDSVLKKLNGICAADTFYFTNTSSIPIKLLDEKVGLQGRIIGYHFYNPPAVQKLVELISPKTINPELHEIALELGKRLRKKLIPSNDIAGFIGNGHFMRDGLHALQEVNNLKKDYSYTEGTYILNRVSQDFLIRPMGIFQLIDYVGIDVFQLILKTMNPYFSEEDLHSDIIDQLVDKKVLGGQNPDGSQKDGFLKYEKSRPVGVYDLERSDYQLFESGDWQKNLDKKMGETPEGFVPWRQLLMDPRKEEKLAGYFKKLPSTEQMGAQLAVTYLKRSKEIGNQLVSQGVADKPENVNGVLLNGFYHLYGPINDYA